MTRKLKILFTPAVNLLKILFDRVHLLSCISHKVDSVKPAYRSENIHMRQKKSSYALFPVWLLNTSRNGDIYTFAMNGQTGRFIGNLPVDWKLFWIKVIQRRVLYGAVIGLALFVMLFR